MTEGVGTVGVEVEGVLWLESMLVIHGWQGNAKWITRPDISRQGNSHWPTIVPVPMFTNSFIKQEITPAGSGR